VSDIDLAILTDIVRELNAELGSSTIEPILKDGKQFILVSQNVWSHVSELIYQIEKANDYEI
jgi:hypothetical protein